MSTVNISKRFNLKLLLLILLQCGFFLFYQHINKAYQTWDSAGHIGLSFRMANEIKGLYEKNPDASFTQLITISNYYPPFVQLIGAAFSLAFGYSSENILLVTLFFFVLTIIFTYKLALFLSKNENLAFYTAAIFSLFPEVIEQSRVFHLDIPLVALLLIAIYFLLTSENLSKTGRVVMFFVFAGLAQITKWYGFIYLIVPFVYVFAPVVLKKVAVPAKKPILNIILGAITTFVICIPWYYYNYADLIKFSKIFSTGESDDPIGILSLANLLFYPSSVLTYQTLLLPFICMVAGLVVMAFKDKKQFVAVSAYLLISPLVFLLIANKNLRYVLPLAPLFAYLVSYFLFSLPKKVSWLKYVVVAYLIAGTAFLSFNKMQARQKGLLPISYAFVGPNYKAWYEIDPVFYSYDPNYYPVDQILDFIYKDANKFGKNPLGIGNLSDSQKFSAATLEMLRLEKHMNNVYLPVPYFQFVPFSSDEEMDSYLTNSGSEYMIAPSWVGPSGLRNYAALTQMSDYLRSGRDINFQKVKSYTFPDGTLVDIFKRNGVTQEFIMPGECGDRAGFLDGIETLKLVPDNTYVLFTGHFALQDKVLRNYEQGVLYVLQIENALNSTYLDVHNLPRSGSTICVRHGLGLDVSDEVTLPLVEKNHCGDGVDCKKVVHVFWRVGEADPILTEFKREDYSK
jgi:hypothetical protein